MDDLLKNHRSISRLFSRKGGLAENGGIEQVLHYERSGSQVQIREELRQNLKPWMERNAKARTHEQRAWNQGIGKEIACIPDSVVEMWKGFYRWDFDKANLNKPEDKAFFHWLLRQPEWAWVKTYDPSADSSRGHLINMKGASHGQTETGASRQTETGGSGNVTA
jgi:hypothetical protein